MTTPSEATERRGRDIQQHGIVNSRPADGSTIASYGPAQWRLLNGLYWAERRTTPVVDCRKLLREQDASSDHLMSLSRDGRVEGVVPGSVIDLATINWHAALRRRNYVSCRLTPSGRSLFRDCPLIMLLNVVGRGRRPCVAAVVGELSLGEANAEWTVRQAEERGLIIAGDSDGRRVYLTMFKRSAVPPSLRLQLTRKGATYLSRKV